MFKYIVELADSSEWTALLPMVFFILIFSIIIFMVSRQKKTHTDKMLNMPFDDATNLDAEQENLK